MPFIREKIPDEFKQQHPEIRQYGHDWLIDRESWFLSTQVAILEAIKNHLYSL